MSEQGKGITWQQNERYQELFSNAEYIGEGVTAVALAARHDLLWQLISEASTMHGDFGINDDGQLERFNYSTAKWKPFSIYGWLVDHLPADSEQDVKDATT